MRTPATLRDIDAPGSPATVRAQIALSLDGIAGICRVGCRPFEPSVASIATFLETGWPATCDRCGEPIEWSLS